MPEEQRNAFPEAAAEAASGAALVSSVEALERFQSPVCDDELQRLAGGVNGLESPLNGLGTQQSSTTRLSCPGHA